MAIEKKFSDELAALRTAVAKVDGASVQVLERNGHANVQEIRAFADRPERFEDKLAAVERAVSAFARTYARHWMTAQANDQFSKTAIEDARQHIGDQVDALEPALDGVDLNARGKILL